MIITINTLLEKLFEFRYFPVEGSIFQNYFNESFQSEWYLSGYILTNLLKEHV